jgi:hypothetical protein
VKATAKRKSGISPPPRVIATSSLVKHSNLWSPLLKSGQRRAEDRKAWVPVLSWTGPLSWDQDGWYPGAEAA